jgi:acyl-CoA synthetase (AMP-forming)/AMP-acid ligase II
MNSVLTIHYGLEFFARRHPQKTAVILGERRLTFDELNRRANRVANALTETGLSKGDRVAALLDNCLEYPEIIYGCSKAGIVLIPLNFRLVAREAQALLEHSEAKLLFLGDRFAEMISEVRADLPHIQSDSFVMLGGETSPEGFLPYEEWTRAAPEEHPGVEVGEEDVFYIGYTSGTTGEPKGAVLSQRSRGLIQLAMAVEYGIGEENVNLTAGAIYHAAPIIFVLLAINVGGTTVILEQSDPEEILRSIEQHKVTNAFMAPTMFHTINSLPKETRERYDVSSVETLISAGASLSSKDKEDTIELFGEGVLHEFYGSTEAGWNTNLRPADQLRKLRSCGKPVIGWEVKLLDLDGREVTGPDEVGEIFVRGEYMFDGYLKNPEATEEAFQDGWFSAGDLGQYDDEGYLYVVGRKKDMIVTGGSNVYPEEVEDCLASHPKVADVAVIGTPDEKWGEAVTAVVVPKEDGVSPEEMISFCEGEISGYKKPKRVEFEDEIPRNPSGKILKNVLRERYGAAGSRM